MDPRPEINVLDRFLEWVGLNEIYKTILDTSIGQFKQCKEIYLIKYMNMSLTRRFQFQVKISQFKLHTKNLKLKCLK